MVNLYESDAWSLKSYGGAYALCLLNKTTGEDVALMGRDMENFEHAMEVATRDNATMEEFLPSFWSTWRAQDVRHERMAKIRPDMERRHAD